MGRGLKVFVIACVLSAVALAQEHKISVQKFEPPVYPQIARQARVMGEVKLLLEVATDGSVTDVKAVSGHPMLKQAAVSNVKLWRFHCDDCGYGKSFTHEISYFFKVRDVGCDRTDRVEVSYLFPGSTTLVAETGPICDPGAIVTRHSWLWRLFHRHRIIFSE